MSCAFDFTFSNFRVPDSDQATATGGRTGSLPIQRKAGPSREGQTLSSRQIGELPDTLKENVQRAFGFDFSNVRVHEGFQAAAIGARAYTHGSDLHFAPGAYDPSSSSGQKVICHELAHVVQQSEGRVSATRQAKGIEINDDDQLEREADTWAELAVRGEPIDRTGAATSPVAGGPVHSSADGEGGGGARNAGPVQCKLTLEGQVIWSIGDLWDELEEHDEANELFRSPEVMSQADEILQSWVTSFGPIGVGRLRLTSAIDRNYPTFKELVQAVLGEIQSRENLAQETALAEKIKDDPEIIHHLKTLMPKIHTYVEQQEDKVKIWKDMQNAYRSLWTFMGGPWKLGGLGWTIEHCMAQPYDNIKANFNCIKMASNALKLNRGAAKMFVPKRDETTKQYDGDETEITKPGNTRYNTMSLKEEWFWTMEAREYHLPLTAGVSGSMNRMYFLAQQVGASNDELVALAWAGHVVFNQHYTLFGNDPHRLHEIMDPLTHYKVIDYNASKYADLVASSLKDGIQWPTRGFDDGASSSGA